MAALLQDGLRYMWRVRLKLLAEPWSVERLLGDLLAYTASHRTATCCASCGDDDCCNLDPMWRSIASVVAISIVAVARTADAAVADAG